MTTNYNLNPYYDDFDENKNFYRMLFKPGFAVQARELTQLQTILQQQIDRFGKHIFVEGTIVLGGAFNIEKNVDAIKLSSAIDLKSIPTDEIKNRFVIGQTTGIKAYVYDIAYKSDWGLTNDILMLRYISSSESSTTFLEDETLIIENSTTSFVTESSNIVGKGSVFSIEEGVLFSKGYFVKFQKQQIIIDPLNALPSAKIGFLVTENIVDSTNDTTLLDPALGSYNYSAPGADRLKVELNLNKVDLETETTEDFFPLFTIKEGNVTELKESTFYARLYDEFAKRTYDESGNYVVNGFGIRTREYLDTGNNEGYLATSNNDLAQIYSTKLAIGVEPGTAYILGYEVNNLVTEYLQADKSLDSQNVNSEILSARNGSYFILEEVVGTIETDKARVVNLYNTAENRKTNSINSLQSPTGVQIGTAKVQSFTYEDDNLYRIYLFDLQMIGSNTISEIRSIGTTRFFGDVVLQSGNAVLQEVEQNVLLYKLGSNFTKTIRDSDGDVDTTFTFQRTYSNITIDSTGTFSVSVSPTDETHAYGSLGTLSSLEKLTVFLSIDEDTSNSLPGIVSVDVSVSNTTINGVGTFFTRLNVGDRITVSNTAGYFYVATTPTSDTILTVTTPFSSNVSSSNTINKVYLAGDIVNLSDKGADSGITRSITVNTNKTLDFDLKETFATSLDASVTFNVTRSSAQEINKILRPNRFVRINCESLSSNTQPINLGFSDVYKIRKITKKTSSFPTDINDGSDVTDSFIFDNGQRDSFYDLASIIPKKPVSITDRLLIELDYFSPDFTQGTGYFSIDSYPIDDTQQSNTTIFTQDIPTYKSSFNGQIYDLRNFLDFRPVKQITSSDSTTVSGSTINPTSTNIFYSKDINGLRSPLPSSQINCDYSYYLARRDLIVCDIKGNLNIIKGVPSNNPVTPQIPQTVMGIAKLFIPPYPSLSYTYGRILGKENQSVVSDNITYVRHTMRDIGVLKQRIENLEYYNAVSLLEKNVSDLLILDENGLDRFKNGFFVDGFLDHSLGATYNPDYNIAVDRKESVIRPFFNLNSFNYNSTPISLSNLTKTGNLVTLPYNEVTLVEQPRVTTFRNIEQSVYRFIGKLQLSPEIDTWVDTTVVDKVIEIGNDLPSQQILTTDYGSWEKITGTESTTIYNVYEREDRVNAITDRDRLVGTFSSFAEAQEFASKGTVIDLSGQEIRLRRYKIEETNSESQSRTQIQTVVTYEKQFQEKGSTLIDVSVVPYIRPQVINIYGQGLKANTQYYVFFDNEDMNSYVTPIINNVKQVEGSNLRSNIFGEIYAELRLPATGKRFRIGTKEIVVTDSPTKSVDASSYAISYFVASGLNAQKENTIISTKVPVVSTKEITIPGSAKTVSKVEIFGPSCMAYSFKVEAPEDEDGVFLTSAEVYIQSKHPTLGIWFEIREMSSDGGITRNQVPYSEVWYKSNEVITTPDATTPHIVQFPSPVYLLNDTQYAFVIHTEGINPDYYFWISRLGETDIINGNPVTGRQLTGSVFTTNNNLNWNIVPDIDLKVKFNRANFTTGVTGTGIFGNRSYEFLNLDDNVVNYQIFGETIEGSQIVTLANVVGSNTIIVGDQIQSGNGTQNVVNIIGSQYFTDGFILSSNDSITILDLSGNTKFITADVSNIIIGTSILNGYDNKNKKIILSNSSGNFFANGYIRGTTSNTISKISSVGEWKYSTVNLKPKSLQLPKTSALFGIRGIKTSTNTLDSNFMSVSADKTIELLDEYCIKSRSTEISSYSSVPSTQFNVQMTSISPYTSPVIDTGFYNSIFVENIINNNITDETNPSGGNLFNKYISKIVTLANGQDAEDLVVLLSAYIPPTTDVKVWMKIQNFEDTSETFDSKPWIEMRRNNPNAFSLISDRSNFISLRYDIPTEYLTGPNGEVQYISSGTTFTGFKRFSVKIGLLGQNSAVVPRVADLQVIALQK
jgi:hypothetical protein